MHKVSTGKRLSRKTSLIGSRFGQLVVTGEAPSYVSPRGAIQRMWRCQCDCGKQCTKNTVTLGKDHHLHCPSTHHRPAPKPKPRQYIVQKFWERVKIGGPDECWEWQAARNGKSRLQSYGIVWFNGRKFKTHRLSYILAKGEIPEGKLVCHKCDNPPCCNPAHLFAGSHHDNSADCHAKGRANLERGEDRYNAMLTEEKVKEIRRRYKKRVHGYEKLAAEYGVGPSMIFAIVKGHRWAHVPRD